MPIARLLRDKRRRLPEVDGRLHTRAVAFKAAALNAIENRAAQRDAGRFDDLLAVLAGAPCPEGLAGEDALPLPREQAIARAVAEAEQRLFLGDEDADEDAVE